jgi:tetratricopeptide (TPR) repeat protein
MKSWYAISLFSLLFINVLHAQSINDSAKYNPGIYLFESSTTSNDYKNAAGYFEQLILQYPEQWLAWYYTGLCYIRASDKEVEVTAKDKLLDKAQPLIDSAFTLNPTGPELHILQAFLYQTRIQVNPVGRGFSYSRKADVSLKKAVAGDPENPRAWSLIAFNVYYTPVPFGGGPQKALPLFIKAKEKFTMYKPALTFMPRWGETENQQMIIDCRKAVKQGT